ncbi:MAG TPA: CHRD domain-containing protein [Rhodothermales bacterium]|nr:CHRD domain-containing protein [Rhodothermales bacterium]
MRHLRFALAVLLLSTPGLLNAQTFFSASLTGDQESHEPSGNGSGTAALVTAENGLRFIVTVDSLTGPIAAAHFHRARAGVDGGVVRTITGDFTDNTATGVWSPADDEPLTEDLIRALWAGELYLNVHTAENGGGEIRGQIYPASGTAFTANLTPDQETNDVESDGSGTASVLLTDDIVLYSVTVTGLTGNVAAAHFHGAQMGVSAGVVKTITGDFVGPTAVGIWTGSDDEPFTEEMATALLTGNLYLNVHTAMFGAGEVRGQVVLNSGWGFTANLDPEQENNNVESDGAGTAALTLTPDGLVFDVTVSGLTGPISNAHFHRAPAGTPGGVVRGIAAELEDGTASGVWKETDGEPLTDELIEALLQGELYLNFHTAAYPGGEIRGQVLAGTGASLGAKLDPFQEQNNVVSSGTGTASLWLTDEGVAYSVTVDSLTGPIAAAHFHRQRAGVNGGVVKTITGDFVGGTANGMWTPADDEPLTAELITELLTGGLYLNVHTASFGGGEVRGQIFVNAGTGLTAYLDSNQEPNDVESAGSGTASVISTPAGVAYSLTVDSLSGPISNAHFHRNPLGVNGGVVKTIAGTFEGNSAIGTWTASDNEPLTDELFRDLIAGNLYLNIHTAANPGGEIRGQVLLNSGLGAAVQLDPDQENAGVTSSGAGTATLSLNPAGLSYAVSVEGLTGPLTMAHFHNAPLGMNGGVVRTVTNEFNGPTASGLWTANDDEPLTDDLLLEVLRGNIYLNVHTAANQGGEIRGQVRANGVVITSVEEVGGEIPNQVSLRQNYPNPFNPATTLEFALDKAVDVRLTVFNALGQEVAVLVDERLAAGVYRANFLAGDLPSGVYLARLEAEGVRDMRRMVLLK